MLLGGSHKDSEINEKNKGFVKIFILTENDPNSKFFLSFKIKKDCLFFLFMLE